MEQVQVKERHWRRWVLLGLLIVGWILGSRFIPVQPAITVAPEKLIEEPLFTLPIIGDFYLVNTLPTLILTVILLVIFAYAVKRSLTQSAQTDLVPRGIGNATEAILEPHRLNFRL